MNYSSAAHIKKKFIQMLLVSGLLLVTGLVTNMIQAQENLPVCQDRPTWVDPPWINGQDWCLEQVINDKSAGEWGYTALAAGGLGTLYATRPMTGEVLAIRDTDGDGLPDTQRVAAEGLTLPNGLAYYDGALYISGGTNIYRLHGDRLDILVNNLPWGTGFWTGGLTIGPDERIYVAIGAPCDYCEPDDNDRGSVWSYALDGSDPQKVADGLRQPGDVAFRDGILWTLDTARDGLTEPNLDELNRVENGAHFGWPYCVGAHNQADMAGAFECQNAFAPALNFPTHSNPIGLTVYTSDVFPKIRDHLLVVLSGNENQSTLQGYLLAAVAFNDEGHPTNYRVIIPERAIDPKDPNPAPLTPEEIQYKGSGFWPHHPIDVAVSPEGWIYISLGGGRIFVLRPL
jgi:glucose/arabinose dehydrogenase